MNLCSLNDNYIFVLEASTMVDVHYLFNTMKESKIMLSYKGDANKEVLSSMLDIIETKLNNTDVNPKTKKKLYNILVECLQNLYHHVDEAEVEGNNQEKELMNASAIFMVAKATEHFKICTGNFIEATEVSALEQRIQHINSLDKAELKTYHKEILNNGEISIKGGGGLGLIDMVRKSGNKLDYCFQKVDNNTYFFTLEIKLSVNH